MLLKCVHVLCLERELELVNWWVGAVVCCELGGKHWLRSSLMPSIFACFHKWMGRRINFCLDGTMFESNNMALWLLRPGMLTHLFTRVGRLVIMMSSMFSLRVGKFTICSLPMSWMVSVEAEVMVLGCYDLWLVLNSSRCLVSSDPLQTTPLKHCTCWAKNGL